MPVRVVPATPQGRVMRRPQHRFNLRQMPWQIQPFMIAPVIPGETLRNLLMQARVVSDPVKNPLIGWWYEAYFFYVKLSDLNARELLTQMVIDPGTDVSTLDEAASTPYYHFGGAPNWTKLCLERCVEMYFRNEGEAWDDHVIDGMPICSLNQDSWLDSTMNAADYQAVDVDVDLNADDTITAQEVDTALRQWQLLRAQGITEMSYEDYLNTFGIRPRPEELHKPELVRYVRQWTYPANTIDPSNGTPSSALSWSIAERADKDRFFREPGFLLGVSVVRPKVYLSKQAGSAVSLMADTLSWLPALLRDDPATSLKLVASGEGPLPLNADEDGYWVDVRDLLIYGDQFINFELTATDAGLVALPTTGLQKRYAVQADAEGLFVGAEPDALVKSDGVVSLAIAGTQVDQTVRV